MRCAIEAGSKVQTLRDRRYADQLLHFIILIIILYTLERRACARTGGDGRQRGTFRKELIAIASIRRTACALRCAALSPATSSQLAIFKESVRDVGSTSRVY